MLSPDPEDEAPPLKKGMFGGLFRKASETKFETSSFMDPDLVDAPPPTVPEADNETFMGQSGSIDLASGKPSPRNQALGSRLGGWLSTATTAAGSRLGVAAQKGATAIQRLSGTERFQDYHDALLRLEASAAELRGEARLAAVQRWVAVLKELGTHCGGLAVAGASARSTHDDSEWQNLHMSPFEGVCDISDGQSAIKANEMLFVDSEHEDEVLTFREVFLGSRALELLLAGYIDRPPQGEAELQLLADLLAAALTADSQAHQELAELFCGVGRQREAAQHPIIVAQQDLGVLVASALGALKIQAGVELLDRKMATLRANISDKAAQAAQIYKFNAGAAHPTKDSSASTVTAGLEATMEIVQLNATLTHLAAQRGALVASAPPPYYSSLIDQLQEHSAETGDSIAEVVRRLELTRAQKSEGEAYRAAKLAEMTAGLEDVVANISVMEQRKAALLQELEVLDQKLFKAKAQWADLDEGRNVFEEGNAFTMEALQQQLDQLLACQDFQVAEEAAVEAAAELLGAAAAGWAAVRPQELASARNVEVETGREYMHAATRHCYYQRAEMQLLLRQLRFCGAELNAIQKKQAEVMDIGQQYFKSVMVDMKAGQSRLATKYIQCESTMLQRLTDLTILRKTFVSCGTPPKGKEAEAAWQAEQQADTDAAAGSLAGTQLRPIPMSDELEDVFQSTDALRKEFELLPRPQGLPPLGEPLPTSHQQSLASEPPDASAGEVAAAEAECIERLHGSFDNSAVSEHGSDRSDHSTLSDRFLADDIAQSQPPASREDMEANSAAVTAALEARECSERDRINRLLDATHPSSSAQLDIASAAVAAHSEEAAAAADLSSSAIGILAAAVSPAPHPGVQAHPGVESQASSQPAPPVLNGWQDHPEQSEAQQPPQQQQQQQQQQTPHQDQDRDGDAESVKHQQKEEAAQLVFADGDFHQDDSQPTRGPDEATSAEANSSPKQSAPMEEGAAVVPQQQPQAQAEADPVEAPAEPDSKPEHQLPKPQTPVRPSWARNNVTNTQEADQGSTQDESGNRPFKPREPRRLGSSVMDMIRKLENTP